jgi:DNA repair exonuclease SbcCD ATPase subunit
MTIYFLQIDPEQDDLYEEYIYLDGQWEKIGNTRIDLSDYVTKAMLQSEVDILNNTITAKESALNQTITNLENKHDQDVQDIQDNIDELNTNISNLNDTLTQNITDTAQSLQDKINNLEDKHNQDITNLTQDLSNLENNVQNAISNTANTLSASIATLESKHDQDITQLEQDINNINNEIDNVHTHDNKAIIDGFDADPKGNLLYNNTKVINEFTEQDVKALLNYLWDVEEYNIISIDGKYIMTKDGRIFTAKEGDS